MLFNKGSIQINDFLNLEQSFNKAKTIFLPTGVSALRTLGMRVMM